MRAPTIPEIEAALTYIVRHLWNARTAGNVDSEAIYDAQLDEWLDRWIAAKPGRHRIDA